MYFYFIQFDEHRTYPEARLDLKERYRFKVHRTTRKQTGLILQNLARWRGAGQISYERGSNKK